MTGHGTERTSLKVIGILAAAAIRIVTTAAGSWPATKGWIAGLGALIVVLEGIQQLKKHPPNGLLRAREKSP